MHTNTRDYAILRRLKVISFIPDFTIAVSDSELSIKEFMLKYGDATAAMAVKLKRRDIWYHLLQHSIGQQLEVQDSILRSIVRSAVINNRTDVIEDVRILCDREDISDLIEHWINIPARRSDDSLLTLSVEELRDRAFSNDHGHKYNVVDPEAAIRYIDICADHELEELLILRDRDMQRLNGGCYWYSLPLSFHTECEKRRLMIRELISPNNLNVECITNVEHVPLASHNLTIHQYVPSKAVRNTVRDAGYKIDARNLCLIDPDEYEMIDMNTVRHVNIWNIHPQLYDACCDRVEGAISRRECRELVRSKPDNYIVSRHAQWHVNMMECEALQKFLSHQVFKYQSYYEREKITSLQLAIALREHVDNDIDTDSILSPHLISYVSLL